VAPQLEPSGQAWHRPLLKRRITPGGLAVRPPARDPV